MLGGAADLLYGFLSLRERVREWAGAALVPDTLR
jgi:hypothetical protein